MLDKFPHCTSLCLYSPFSEPLRLHTLSKDITTIKKANIFFSSSQLQLQLLVPLFDGLERHKKPADKMMIPAMSRHIFLAVYGSNVWNPQTLILGNQNIYKHEKHGNRAHLLWPPAIVAYTRHILWTFEAVWQ